MLLQVFQSITRELKDYGQNSIELFVDTNIFNFMEEQGILDSLNGLHLFCLHYVYLPRIQQAVTEFTNRWNNHGLSTQGGQTALQLWHSGVINSIGIQLVINDIAHMDTRYDINEQEPFPGVQTNNDVTIPAINMTINETTMNIIRQVNPVENDGNYGIDVFSSLLHIF